MTFQLSTLLLVITLIAACLGLARLAPGLGIAAAALATPALVRVIMAGRKLRSQGKPLTLEEKVFYFFTSLAVIVSVATASGIAFYATCWIGFLGVAYATELGRPGKGYDALAYGLLAGGIAGILAALPVLIFMLRYLWPLRKLK